MNDAQIFTFVQAYDPATSNIGFLKAPIDQLAAFCTGWLVPQGVSHAVTFRGAFGQAMQRLFPLTQRRYLLIECRNGWTALFRDIDDSMECKLSHIARSVPCRGIGISVKEDTYDPQADQGTLGTTQLFVLEPHITDALNWGRTIFSAHDLTGWVFEAVGDPLPFEEFEKYESRRVQDRFTPAMLGRYLHALGIDAFSREFYGPNCVLFGH